MFDEKRFFKVIEYNGNKDIMLKYIYLNCLGIKLENMIQEDNKNKIYFSLPKTININFDDDEIVLESGYKKIRGIDIKNKDKERIIDICKDIYIDIIHYSLYYSDSVFPEYEKYSLRNLLKFYCTTRKDSEWTDYDMQETMATYSEILNKLKEEKKDEEV